MLQNGFRAVLPNLNNGLLALYQHKVEGRGVCQISQTNHPAQHTATDCRDHGSTSSVTLLLLSQPSVTRGSVLKYSSFRENHQIVSKNCVSGGAGQNEKENFRDRGKIVEMKNVTSWKGIKT